MNETIRMQLSAYVDGELPESETELLLRRLSQDAALRAEVAEFMEIGRVMRREHTVRGIHSLRNRIESVLDDDGGIPTTADEPRQERNFRKPLGGVAIAAAVALVAIVGLQQTANQEPGSTLAGSGSTDAVAVEYVVPPDDPELREFHRMHTESSSAQGANGMNVRIVSFPLRDDADEEVTDAEAPETDAGSDTSAGTE